MPNTREKLIERLPVDDAILILREELKQRADGYATHLSYGGKGDPAEEVNIDALEMAISALEQMKWISVKERLPDKSDYYLAFTDTCVIGVLPFSAQYRLFNAFDGDGTKHHIPVTHWMSLPEPPKGE